MSGEQIRMEGRWVMTSVVTRDPEWLLTFRIGAIRVATIHFRTNKLVELNMWGRPSEFFAEPKSVSRAMTRMHELLKSPPPNQEGERP